MSPPSPLPRVVHLTFHKCGSQWVRDVLTTPEIVAASGVSRHRETTAENRGEWPAQAPGTFAGPLYNRSYEEWTRRRAPGMKAIVVLRDPRDRLVSWVYSFSYSHVPNAAVRVIREPLLAVDSRNKVMLGMFEFSRIWRYFRDWAKAAPASDLLVTTYERIVDSQLEEFQRMVDFLGWSLPDGVLAGAVEALSFEKRSGRARGETDIYSHYRRGSPGDWRSHFTRELGEVFESRFPGLLVTLGYEKERGWFEDLPEMLASDERDPGSGAEDPRLHELAAHVTRLQEQNAELRRQLEHERLRTGGLGVTPVL